jgi:hypothetical protein
MAIIVSTVDPLVLEGESGAIINIYDLQIFIKPIPNHSKAPLSPLSLQKAQDTSSVGCCCRV